MNIRYIIVIFILIVFINVTNNNIDNFKNPKIKKKKKYKKIDDAKLNGKVILITGSTRGLGLEIASSLSHYKCKLVINGRDKSKIDIIVKKLHKFNIDIIGIKGDVSKEKNVDNLIKKSVEKFGKIDVVINCAGIMKGKRDLTSKNINDWRDEFKVNVDGVFICSQKVIQYMKENGIKGRIINISSQSSKLKDTNTRSGSQILSKNMIEKMSDIMADENYRLRIAITTIRIDENLSGGSKDFLPFEIPESMNFIGKNLDSMLSFFTSKPSKIIPVFLYAIKAPFHEVSGKLISTSTYLENPELTKVVPAYQIALDKNLYSKLRLNKRMNYKKNPDIKLLVKQNPYGHSPKVEKMVKKAQFSFNKYNSPVTHQLDLDEYIAKNLNIRKNNITFFRNEYDAIKKVVELFVTNYGEAIALYPCWSYFFIICNEKKITMKQTVLKEKDKKSLQPDFYIAFRYITSKTKLIYLSSPNCTTGQSINIKEFEKFLDKIPNNIIILIDQRFIEFSQNKQALNPLKYLDRNIIILRSFNNFYGLENLELAYIIANKHISGILYRSQMLINSIDQFTEDMALTVMKDKKHNEKIINYIKNEKFRICKILKERNVKYFPSETNFLLIETNKNLAEIKKEMEKNEIILYESDDQYNNYWTLPIMDKETNNQVLRIITSYYT